MAKTKPQIQLPPPGGRKDLLGATILGTLDVVVGIISNKYSSQLSILAILLICLIPIILWIVWIWRRERQQGRLAFLFNQHPVSYSVIAIVAIAFFCEAGSILVFRLLDVSKQTTATGDTDRGGGGKTKKDDSTPHGGAGAPSTAPSQQPATHPPQNAQPATTGKATNKKGFDPGKYGLKEVAICPPGSTPFTVNHSSSVVGNNGWGVAVGPDVCVLIDNHSYIQGGAGGVCVDCGVRFCSKFHQVPGCPPIPGTEAQRTPPLGGVIQSGTDNQQTVPQAPITQQNSGGCNQQVVGGNNNSNFCVPPARELTGNQKAKLAAAAEEIPKTIMVVVGSADDQESQNYAEEIRKVFEEHGTTRARGTLFGWHPKGVFITVHSADDAAALPAQRLGFQLNKMGFSIANVELDPQRNHEGEIHILVGDQ